MTELTLEQRGATGTYISRLPCGCVCGLCVDDPDSKREVAKWIAKEIRSGATIERCTVKDVWDGKVALELTKHDECKKAARRKKREQANLFS